MVVGASGRYSDIAIGVADAASPVVAWSSRARAGGLAWARRRVDGTWTAPRRMPGLELGGFYGTRHAWVVSDNDGALAVRRGSLPGRFGAPVRLVAERVNWWLSDTSPRGHVAVAAETFSEGSSQRRLWFAFRRPGGAFRPAQLLWPRRVGDIDVWLTDRGNGILAWSSRGVVYAAGIRRGRVGGVRRLAEPSAAVPSVFAEVDPKGSAVVGWLVATRPRTIQSVTLGRPPDGPPALGAIRDRVRHESRVDSPPAPAAWPGGAFSRGTVAVAAAGHPNCGHLTSDRGSSARRDGCHPPIGARAGSPTHRGRTAAWRCSGAKVDRAASCAGRGSTLPYGVARADWSRGLR